MGSRFKFPKPVDHYAILRMFGPNVIASEGEEWRKYRRIAAPAFSEVTLVTFRCLDLNTITRKTTN